MSVTSSEPWFLQPVAPATAIRQESESPNPDTDAAEWLVIGAGLAGCTTARELARRGCRVTLVDRAPEAAMAASANQHALLRPHASRGTNFSDLFFADAYRESLTLLSDLSGAGPTNEVFSNLQGVLQLVKTTDSYVESNHLQILSPQAASKVCGLDLARSGLFFPTAGSVNIPQFCKALICHPHIILRSSFNVTGLSKENDLWSVTNGTVTVTARHVILANGADIIDYPQTAHLGIVKAQGQSTLINPAALDSPNIPVCGRQYLVPISVPTGDEPANSRARTLWQTGATFHRGSFDQIIRADDEQKNLLECAALLRDATQGISQHSDKETDPVIRKLLSGMTAQDNWVGVRATTPDRLPILGAVPDHTFYSTHYADLRHGRPANRYPAARYLSNLYVNGGYGSRGLCVSALCARVLADHLLGNEGSMERHQDYLRLLHPARFHIRQLKKSAEAGPAR